MQELEIGNSESPLQGDQMIKTLKPSIILLLFLFLVSCTPKDMNNFNAYEYRTFSEDEMMVLADGIHNIIKQDYLPAKTTIFLVKKESFLNDLVEAKLRLEGYPVVGLSPDTKHRYDQKEDKVLVDYAVEGYKDFTIIRVSLNKEREAGRVYELKEDGKLKAKTGYTRHVNGNENE